MLHRFRYIYPVISLLLYLGSLCSSLAYAGTPSLEQQIAELLNHGMDKNITRTVTILTPEKQRKAICAQPKISLSGNDTRLAGNRSVITQCGMERKFLQINIKAEGKWWVATRTLPIGTQIQAADIKQQYGSMDRLPSGLLMDKDEIVGRIATRAINAGQSLQGNQMRKHWVIVAGENVDVLAEGNGFSIKVGGTAMDNAALHQNIRVKTKSGQITTGKVISAGKVSVSVQH